MRIFFPTLLLVVALIVFVISACILFPFLPTLYDLIVDLVTRSNQGGLPIYRHDEVVVVSLLLNLLLSVWAAAWTWKEIQRVRIGRLEG